MLKIIIVKMSAHMVMKWKQNLQMQILQLYSLCVSIYGTSLKDC